MKKIIPFSKEMLFKTKIEEITSIAIDNTLKLDNNIVSGEFLINGTYKMINDGELENEFKYAIPVDITIDDKYNTNNCTISIDDFTYEIINEDTLKVNISVMLDDLDIKEEITEINTRDLGLDDKEIEEASIINNSNNKTIKVNVDNDVNINSKIENSLEDELLNKMDTDSEYSIYRVYTMKEEDTIESILDKYKITKELLSDYNDLDNLKVGDKIIIPSIDE